MLLLLREDIPASGREVCGTPELTNINVMLGEIHDSCREKQMAPNGQDEMLLSARYLELHRTFCRAAFLSTFAVTGNKTMRG